MKKQVLLLMLLIVALVSCEGPAGRDGLDGDGVGWHIKTFVVKENEWSLENKGDASFWFCEKKYPELNNWVFKNGVVLAYITLNPGAKDEILAPLEHTIYGYAPEGPEFDWAETYSFDYMEGNVGFYVRYSDFFEDKAPSTQEFRVVLMY